MAMNDLIARVIEGWNTYTVRKLGSKFYICKNTPTPGPPLLAGLEMTEAIDKCREMNAVESIKAMREPTEVMLDAVTQTGKSLPPPLDMWMTMINAAVK
jgi:hypothetical protein